MSAMEQPGPSMAGESDYPEQYPLQDALLAIVEVDYTPSGDFSDRQLTLSKGDVVHVLERDERDQSGWWGGHKHGDDLTGWFPATIVTVVRVADDDESGLEDESSQQSSQHLRGCGGGGSPDPTRTGDNRPVASPQAGYRRHTSGDSGSQAPWWELVDAKQRLEKAVGAVAAAEARAAQLEGEQSAHLEQWEGLRQERAQEEQQWEQERQEWDKERQHLVRTAKELDAARQAGDAEVRRLQEELRRCEGELSHQRSQFAAFEERAQEQRVGRPIVRDASVGQAGAPPLTSREMPLSRENSFVRETCAGQAVVLPATCREMPLSREGSFVPPTSREMPLSREGSFVREASAGPPMPVSRRLFDAPDQLPTPQQTPQPPTARAPLPGPAPAPLQMSAAAMPTIATLPPGSTQPSLVVTGPPQPVGSSSGQLSARHTMPTPGQSHAAPHLHPMLAAGPPTGPPNINSGPPPPGQPPRPGAPAPRGPYPARAASVSAGTTSPMARVRTIQGDQPTPSSAKREVPVRSLVAAFERKSSSATPPAAAAAAMPPPSMRPAEPSPCRQMATVARPGAHQPRQVMGSCNRAASREAPTTHHVPPPPGAPPEAETPRAHPGGGEDAAAINFGMSPMVQRQRQQMARSGSVPPAPSPGRTLSTSSPSPMKLSVQDRVRQLNNGRFGR